MTYGRNREPHALIASVGWSLGGNVTLKALAEEGDAAPIDIAAAASVPFDIRPCAERLRTGLSRIYQKRLLDALKDALRRKHLRIEPSPLLNLAAALVAQDFIEYDEAYTAPLAGYRDAEECYTHSSCGHLLRDIRCPTLVVHAQDDPFMTADIAPALDAASYRWNRRSECATDSSCGPSMLSLRTQRARHASGPPPRDQPLHDG